MRWTKTFGWRSLASLGACLTVAACAAPVSSSDSEPAHEQVGKHRDALRCEECDPGGGGDPGGGSGGDPGGGSGGDPGGGDPGGDPSGGDPGGGSGGPPWWSGGGPGWGWGSGIDLGAGTDGNFDCTGNVCSWQLSPADPRVFTVQAAGCSSTSDGCTNQCASAGGDYPRCRNNCDRAFNRLCPIS